MNAAAPGPNQCSECLADYGTHWPSCSQYRGK